MRNGGRPPTASGDDAGGAEFFDAIAEAELGQHFVGVLAQIWGNAGERGRGAVEVGGVAGETCPSDGRMIELCEHTDRLGVGIIHDLGGREHHRKSHAFELEACDGLGLCEVGSHGVAHVDDGFEHVAVHASLSHSGDAGVVEPFNVQGLAHSGEVGVGGGHDDAPAVVEAHGLEAGVEA